MNDTAKKLREAAEPMRGSGIAAAYAIRLVQKMLDTESTPTFSGNLAAALDELADTIQACCNLASALGVTDLTPYLAACEERNRKRGRYE